MAVAGGVQRGGNAEESLPEFTVTYTSEFNDAFWENFERMNSFETPEVEERPFVEDDTYTVLPEEEVTAFVMPMPVAVPVAAPTPMPMPPVVPAAGVIGVASQVLGAAIGFLWPSNIEPDPDVQVIKAPEKTPTPIEIPVLDPITIIAPKAPEFVVAPMPARIDYQDPGIFQEDEWIAPLQVPAPTATPVPTIITTPVTTPAPSPTPTPLPFMLPFQLPMPATSPQPFESPFETPYMPFAVPMPSIPLPLPSVPAPSTPMPSLPFMPSMPAAPLPAMPMPAIPMPAMPSSTPTPTALPFDLPLQTGECPPCEKAKEKEKEKKKRKDRMVCYKGTFTETSRSTLKKRRERVPCQ